MLKVGLIGCGFVAEKYHMPCYLMFDDVKVAAVCDINKGRLRKFGQKFAIKNQFERITDLLSYKDIDFVDICTPGFLHFRHCMKVIQYGKDVLVEKPIALSSKQAHEILNRSRKVDIKVGVVQNYRFHDPIIELKKKISEGLIGRIISSTVIQHGGSIFDQPFWLWNENVSGGILYEFGFHAIDLQTYFMGPHKRIVGLISKYNPHLQLTTSIQALVEYQNGSSGFLDITYFSSSQFLSLNLYTTTIDATVKFFPDSLTLKIGEWPPLQELLGDLKRFYKFAKAVLRNRYKINSLMPHYRAIKAFKSSLIKDEPPPVAIEDVIPTMKFLEEVKSKLRRSKLNWQPSHRSPR